jgi:hypothetical protein
MASVSRTTLLGAVIALALALPGALRAEEGVGGGCSQDADHPPERGQMGSISVVTTPEKAVVYLGGVKLGPTPVDTAFASGRHSLTIMLNGEELIKERINICAGEKTTYEKTLLMPYGSVAIKTNPIKMNAKVTVDGEDVGSTHGGVLTINRLEAGTRVIKISNGGRHKELSVNVLPEQTVDVNVDFKR